jgi:hypothetical protein
MNGMQSSGSVAFSGKVCSNRRRKESSARLMLLVHVGLNRVMSDPKIEGRLVELSAGERAFCARHYPQRLLNQAFAKNLSNVAPRVVVLTPGSPTSAYFEPSFLTQQMGGDYSGRSSRFHRWVSDKAERHRRGDLRNILRHAANQRGGRPTGGTAMKTHHRPRTSQNSGVV